MKYLGGAVTALLCLALAAWSLKILWPLWRQDSMLTHSPILALVAAGLLVWRRNDLKHWDSADKWGLGLLGISAVLEIIAGWGEIVFLQPLAFLGMLLGIVWFLGGRETMRVCAWPLGLFMFTVPWPTTLVSALAFPMQLTSSAYAALFAGMFGLSIHREGVHLSVISPEGDKAIYSMIVAQQCSGLTSLLVLLAFGYLIAYFTPRAWWGRLLLVLTVIPLALFANAVRLTIILVVGGLTNPQWATWVHDNEQPVLIFFCSFGLLGLRQLLMQRLPDPDAPKTVTVAVPQPEETVEVSTDEE
ncbi:MAG: exosortase/archaeosortase family protein [Armatimonas sp.]